MRRALLSTAAVLAMTVAAQAQSSHANPDYPSPEALEQAGPGQNLGGFGRLFSVRAPDRPDGLLPHPSPRYDLVRLGQRMAVPNEEAQPPGEMPVGYVFLAQFIDHDVTFDTVTSFDEIAATTVVENARTADLDLDCVYGGGPERDPYLYDGPYLRVGAVVVAGEASRTRYDVLRAPGPARPTAVIGDPRNDENFAIAQVQAAFIAFHNRMVDRILEHRAEEARRLLDRARGEAAVAARESTSAVRSRSALAGGDLAHLVAASVAGPQLETSGRAPNITRELVLEVAAANGRVGEILEEARAATIHHYHRIVAEDFVPRIIGIARTRDILENGRDFYFPNGFRTADGRVTEPFIPISFAVAAYRFAHSQVPGIMRLRGDRQDAVLAELFGADKSLQAPNFLTPNAFTPIRTDAGSLVVDWNLFVPIHGPAGLVQRARRLDTVLADPLTVLDRVGVVPPTHLGVLASRNLSRGRTYMLPAGQTLARLVLSRLDERGVLQNIYPGGNTVEDYVLPADETTRETLGLGVTPLWYYVLQEADTFGATWEQGAAARESAFAGASEAVRLTGLPEAVGLDAGGLQETSGRARGSSGATLGPVGATLVGEVLLGLVDYHREAEGEGLDLNPSWRYEILPPEAGPIAAGDLPAMTETAFEVAGSSFGRRYLFRNFLHDAGVSLTPRPQDVCRGPATLEAEGC